MCMNTIQEKTESINHSSPYELISIKQNNRIAKSIRNYYITCNETKFVTSIYDFSE